MTALISCFHICSPVLWIRLQIGSIFSNLVDPDPYSEHGSRSGYTQTQTDINLPPQSKLSSCAFNFVLYSLKKVFWKCSLQNCKNTIQCTYTYVHVHRTLQVFVLQNKTFLGWTFSPNMLFVKVHTVQCTPSCWFRWLVSARPTRFFLVNEHVRVRCWVGWVDFGYEIYQITNFYLILLLYIQRFVSIIILWFFL